MGNFSGRQREELISGVRLLDSRKVKLMQDDEKLLDAHLIHKSGSPMSTTFITKEG